MSTNEHHPIRPWRPTTPVFLIEYEDADKAAYAMNDPSGKFYPRRWNPNLTEKNRRALENIEIPCKDYWKKVYGGRGSHGEFPLVVARSYFLSKNYTVLASEPRLPKGQGYILLSYPRLRRRDHDAYREMRKYFDAGVIQKLNDHADKIKKTALNGGCGGGDPDLFVVKGGTQNQFFIEVKDVGDTLRRRQHACFPLIERFLRCHVRIVQIAPRAKQTITQQCIDNVISFLPRLRALSAEQIAVWPKARMLGDLPELVLEPKYDPIICALIVALNENRFVRKFDWGKWQMRAQALFRRPKAISVANLDTCAKLLTLHVRKDRFCGGHFGEMVRCGHITAILRRLAALRRTAPILLLS